MVSIEVQKLPNAIRECRREARFSQRRTASIIGCTPARISLWETSTVEPSARYLFRLGSLFNRRPEELLPDLQKQEMEFVRERLAMFT